jgi:hypothetical protein
MQTERCIGGFNQHERNAGQQIESFDDSPEISEEDEG